MAASIPIVCPYCGVGCNLDLALDETGRPIKCRATGRNPELNAKYACVKGFTVHELLNHAERLTQPEDGASREMTRLGHNNLSEIYCLHLYLPR